MSRFFFKSHKACAFYISAAIFLLPFALFASVFNAFELKNPSHDRHSLSLTHFVTEPTPPAPQVSNEAEPQTPPELAQPQPTKAATTRPKPQKKRSKPSQKQQIASNQNGDDIQNYVVGQDEDEFLKALKRAVDAKRHYPLKARRMGQQGIVVVEFRLTKEGILRDLRLVKSSSHRTLDENALKTIQRAAAAFPRHAKEVAIRFPFHYSLHD